MDKLKTLKDIEKDDWNGVKGVYSDELKAEAVKWVKTCPHWSCSWKHLINKPLKCSVCLMMFEFFNLTEEDLKDG